MPGARWIAPALGTFVFAYGGWPFVRGAVSELRDRLPGMHFSADYVRAGGLLSHGTDQIAQYRRAGWYVARILAGTRPAAWWAGQLQVLEGAYPHRIGRPQGNHYGMHLFSRLEIGAPAVRFLVAALSPRQRWMYCFLALSTLLIVVSYTSPVNLLPYLAAVVGTIGSFQRNVILVRALMAVGATSWVVHNLLVGSPVAVLMELAFLSSNLVGYIRSRRQSLPAAEH